MQPGDARLTINTDALSDPRVQQFWDGDRTVGAWFASQVEHDSGVAWDVYYLYGPDAHWTAIPEPLISSGSPVIEQQDKLATSILPLLTTP